MLHSSMKRYPVIRLGQLLHHDPLHFVEGEINLRANLWRYVWHRSQLAIVHLQFKECGVYWEQRQHHFGSQNVAAFGSYTGVYGFL